MTLAFLYKGCTIAYAESVETVAANLLEVRPHIMVSVPRLFEKLYAKIMDNVLLGSSLKRKIFAWAIRVGTDHSRRPLAGKPIRADSPQAPWPASSSSRRSWRRPAAGSASSSRAAPRSPRTSPSSSTPSGSSSWRATA